jgi:hypothetical protein
MDEGFTSIKREFEIFKQFLGFKTASIGTEETLSRAREEAARLEDAANAKRKSYAEMSNS